jgi:CHAT domain-containing protein
MSLFGLCAAQARTPSPGQPLPAPAIIAADPALRELAGQVEALRKRGSAAAWELAWDLENAADRLNGDQVIAPGSGHPQEARQLLVEALALLPNAHRPPNMLGPDVPFLRQQAHYGLGKAALDLYDQRGAEYAASHPISLSTLAAPRPWETTSEAIQLLTDSATSFGAAIQDEADTARGNWQPETDQMMRARLGLLQAVWSRQMWPETFAAAEGVYDFLYSLSARQAELSYLLQQRAVSQLKGLVTGYLGYLTLKQAGIRSENYLFRALQMAEAGYELHALDLAASRVAPSVSGAAGLLHDFQLALEDARAAEREIYARHAALFSRFLSIQQVTSDQVLSEAYERRRTALGRAEQARAALTTSHPLEASILTPRIVSITDIQAALKPGEAMLFIYVDAVDTVCWVITPTASNFHIAPFSFEKRVSEDIAMLRRSLRLDPAAEHPPAFEGRAAWRLYNLLIAPVRPLLKDTRLLLLVESSQLRSIPLAVLLEQEPATDTLDVKAARTAQWLARDFAFSLLPTASSFPALRSRRMPRPPSQELLLGIGDPDLHDGCSASLTALMPRATGTSDRTAIIGLCDLPGAGSELDRVAAAIAPPPASRVVLEKTDATFSKVMAADPGRFEVLYFATHALLPSPTAKSSGGLRQAALVLTPEGGSDGRALLKTSDIMPMQLSADLVVLSGCDTAGGGENSAEALTGLARAFFFAGARDLMATNWPVDSNATVALMNSVFDRMKTTPQENMPQVLQAAQLAMLSHPSEPDYAHPIFWGSFISVGDGERPGAPQ